MLHKFASTKVVFQIREGKEYSKELKIIAECFFFFSYIYVFYCVFCLWWVYKCMKDQKKLLYEKQKAEMRY